MNTSGSTPTGTGIVVTGNITSDVGAIWVWAEAGNSTHVANDHIHEGDQFAFHVQGSVGESSLNAFRNARVDADSGASVALYGVKNTESGKESEVIWGTIGGSDVWFRKVDGFGEGLGGAGFTLYKTLEGAKISDTTEVVVITGDQVTENVVMSASTVDEAAGIEIGDVNFRAPVGTYYMKETTVPDGYANDSIYIVLVGSGSVTVPSTRPTDGDWSAGGILGSLSENDADIQAVVNAQRGTPDDSGKYPYDSAIFLIDDSIAGKPKAVATPDIATFGIMNTSAKSRKVILRKVDGDNYTSLSGARFRIFRADMSEYTEGQPTTSVGGTEVSKGYYESLDSAVYFIGKLPFGTYYMEETKKPDGYAKPTHYFVFKVDENGVTQMGETNWETTPTNKLKPSQRTADTVPTP